MCWFLAILAFVLGLAVLAAEFSDVFSSLSSGKEYQSIGQVVAVLQELQETLEAGLVPATERWENLRSLSEPWGSLTFQSISDLRQSGGSLLPTLRRLRTLALDHQTSLKSAKARSAQALAQALVCAALVPIFGAALYLFLPGIYERPIVWLSACLFSMALTGAGACWLLTMANAARWGGVKQEQRAWILAAQAGGEKMLSLLRSGLTSDVAWMKTTEFIATRAPDLASQWGFSLWEVSKSGLTYSYQALQPLLSLGTAIKKAIHVSVIEGRPCTERIETGLYAFGQEMRAQVDRELTLLANRALKPLFLCVAPSLMGLLGLGLYLAWLEAR